MPKPKLAPDLKANVLSEVNSIINNYSPELNKLNIEKGGCYFMPNDEIVIDEEVQRKLNLKTKDEIMGILNPKSILIFGT